MTGVWIVAQDHMGIITLYEMETENKARELANVLPGTVDVAYQNAINFPESDTMSNTIPNNPYTDHRAKLLEDVVLADQAYHEGVERLKRQRRDAIRRAVYGRVKRSEIGSRIRSIPTGTLGVSDRTITYIIQSEKGH